MLTAIIVLLILLLLTQISTLAVLIIAVSQGFREWRHAGRGQASPRMPLR